MSTVQNSHEKRTIRVKEFLDDFRAGMPDDELLPKYNLTPVGLEKFYAMLQERGILDPQEIEARHRRTEEAEIEGGPIGTDVSAFICPSCLTSHEVMFDVCPKCKVSFQDLIARNEDEPAEGPTECKSREGKVDSATEVQPEDFFGEDHSRKAIEIPEDPLDDKYFAESAPGTRNQNRFEAAEEFARIRGGFEDGLDEIVPGMPLDNYSQDALEGTAEPHAICDGCKEKLAPALRDVYDHNRSKQAAVGAGICFVLGFLGAAALGLFDGYSLGRLVVVYMTGMAMLFGAMLSGVGAFMYLAREKVFYCSSCKRVYPRG